MDNPTEFRRKNRAQFDRARQFLERAGEEFVILIASDLVENTPGFGNQDPADTRYVPTGRLRGGWNWTRTPIGETTKFEGGPYSDYGAETVARIEGQVRGADLSGISYLENNVAYGVLIQRGEGRHANIRDWPDETFQKARSDFFTRQAAAKAMQRG